MKGIFVCAYNKAVNDLITEYPRRASQYNWIHAMKMDMGVPQTKQFAEKYDFIHVNANPGSWNLIYKMRDLLGHNSSTQLVITNDHAINLWAGWNKSPEEYKRIQQIADKVIATEPVSQSYIDTKSYLVPHPIDTDSYYKLFKRNDTKFNRIGYIHHAYNDMTYHAYQAFDALKKELKFQTVLHNSGDKCNGWVNGMFDVQYEPMKFPEHIKNIMLNKVMVEPYDLYVQGRNFLEQSMLGIPTVVNDRVYSAKVICPELVVNFWNKKEVTDKIKKLWLDDDYRHIISNTMKQNVEYFNYDNSKNRYMEMLNDGTRTR